MYDSQGTLQLWLYLAPQSHWTAYSELGRCETCLLTSSQQAGELFCATHIQRERERIRQTETETWVHTHVERKQTNKNRPSQLTLKLGSMQILTGNCDITHGARTE